jgi:hypothetical protein
MNIQAVNQVRDLIQWIKLNTDKSANFEIDFWAHRSEEKETVNYKLWVNDLLNIQTENLSELVERLNDIKQLCTLHKELAA